MALIFMDGFDHYDDNQIPDKWDNTPQNGSIVVPGRWGGTDGALRLYGNAPSGIVLKKFDKQDTYDTIYFGGALNTEGLQLIDAVQDPLIAFEDKTGQEQVCIHGAGAVFNVYRNHGTSRVLLGSGGSYYTTWCYLEVKVKVHATAGEVVIRMNENVVLNLTNVNTKAGTDYIDQLYIMARPFSYGEWDDVYIDNAQFHGNVRVRTFTPGADGTHTQFSRSGGAADYECVDEEYTNEDTDYIYTATKGQKSTFGITTGLLGGVKAIQLNHHVKASDSGMRRLRPLIRSGGSDYYGRVSGGILNEYKYKSRIFATDPQDGQPWNQTKLEAAEFGLEIAAGSTTTSTTSTTTTT